MKIIRRNHVGFLSDVFVFFMVIFTAVLLSIPSYFDETLILGEKICACGLPVIMISLHLLFTRKLKITPKRNID